jgi:hypothetical protein
MRFVSGRRAYRRAITIIMTGAPAHTGASDVRSAVAGGASQVLTEDVWITATQKAARIAREVYVPAVVWDVPTGARNKV